MNCKPGDMALIVSVQVMHQNLGRCVEVLELIPHRTPARWRVKMLGGPAPTRGGAASVYGNIRDSSLLPIRPEPDPLASKRRKTADV